MVAHPPVGPQSLVWLSSTRLETPADEGHARVVQRRAPVAGVTRKAEVPSRLSGDDGRAATESCRDWQPPRGSSPSPALPPPHTAPARVFASVRASPPPPGDVGRGLRPAGVTAHRPLNAGSPTNSVFAPLPGAGATGSVRKGTERLARRCRPCAPRVAPTAITQAPRCGSHRTLPRGGLGDRARRRSRKVE